MVDTNASMRNAMHKNAVEQSACENTRRSIEAEKRLLQTRRTREETELKAQLQRLHLEKILHSEQDNTSDNGSEEADTLDDQLTSLDNDPFAFQPDEVINPYPITTRPKPSSANNDNGGRGSGSSFDQSTSNTTDNIWPGDPEAISSVRRARKSPSRQRMDQIWNRSKSLKERPSSRSSISATPVIPRGSTRDSITGDSSPISGSPGTSGTCSRTGSLKESRQTSRAFSKPLIDGFSESQLTHADIVPRRALSLKVRTGSTSLRASTSSTDPPEHAPLFGRSRLSRHRAPSGGGQLEGHPGSVASLGNAAAVDAGKQRLSRSPLTRSTDG